ARHDRVAGEMALEERLVHRHALHADDRLVRAIFLRPVHEQERIAVRDPFQDLADLDIGLRLFADRRLAAHSPDSSLRRVAILASHAVSRIQRFSGRAGDPPQVSLAGTSFITPAAAAIRAPGPITTWSATPARP